MVANLFLDPDDLTPDEWERLDRDLFDTPDTPDTAENGKDDAADEHATPDAPGA